MIIDQVDVLPGAVMSLKVAFTLSKAIGMATVYSQADAQAPVGYRHEELVMTPEEVRSTIPLDGLQGRIYATREGLVGYTTANGTRYSIARPVCRPSLASSFMQPGRVSVSGAPVLWRQNRPRPRSGMSAPGIPKMITGTPLQPVKMFRDLPQGKPEAQAANLEGYNGGKDMFGRKVLNPAGIDLADGTFWDDLKLSTNTWITVEYLWVESGCSCTGPESGIGMHNRQR